MRRESALRPAEKDDAIRQKVWVRLAGMGCLYYNKDM